MEKILRRKFIGLSFSVVVIVLLLIAIVLNVSNYMEIDDTANEISSILSDNDGVFPKVMERDSKKLSQETPYATRYFTVKLSESSEVISVDTRNIQMVSTDDAISYGKDIIDQGKQSDFFSHYKLSLTETDYGYLVIGIDCAEELNLFHSFLISSVQICLVALVLIFILIVLFSKKAVKPIVESYRKQQQFITNITHELKTPLAIIKTNTEVIEFENEESEWSKSIHNQIGRLNGLVNYLVSLSKMDEEGRKIIKVDFSLSDAMSETMESFILLAKSENKFSPSASVISPLQASEITGLKNEKKEIDLQIAPDITYHGDEQSIRLLLSILMDNAIKYSVDGTKIFAILSRHKEKIIIEINNFAENLEVKNYNILFERFYRLENSRNSQTGGFGIGLAIAKTIVKNHGGDIKAESKDGEKIIFKIEL
ncbi:MAG: HAMP domain-containing sensor histidine kinase [Eubacteriales bacterium]